jgi:hypothetical protein
VPELDEGKTTFHTKLAVDPMQVELNRSFGDVELARDRFIGVTLGGQEHHFVLAHTQDAAMKYAVHSVH